MKKKIFPITTLFLIAGLLPACSNGKSGTDVVPEEKAAVYTVTFNDCHGNITRETGETGKEIAVPTPKTPAGKQFVGWSTKYKPSAKSGDETALISGKKYKIGTSNAVLYATFNSQPDHTDAEVQAYMNQIKESSQDNHLYYHYYRFDAEYSDWDVWAWAYKPNAGEGAKFDWVGEPDDFGGVYVDIDLGHTYKGGWDASTKQFKDLDVVYAGATQIGLQIVKSSTRQSGSGFWVNDGSNLFIELSEYAMDIGGGKTAYHIFVVQDNVQNPQKAPTTSNVDPFENDDGNNTTYGNSAYDNVSWGQSATTGLETSSDFKEIGVGYQIMVSSFADSDGDGSGDIYGITQKLDYLSKLGVKALWLTPIQLSDSYHGYDITDYEKVDPKFGSSESPAAKQAGKVTSETAMQDYKDLITQAHAKGMKIVMDLVLNHTSTSNKWFVSSANLDSEYRGYYQWGNHNTQAAIKETNNWYPYGDHPYSYYAKFGSAMPELNFSYKSTREAVEAMSVHWAKDIGVDGFRLDAVKHIYMENEVSSTSGDTIVYDKSDSGDYSSDLTKNIHFFKELKSAVTKGSGKNVFFVGENFDGHAYHVAPYYQAFDSLFDFYAYFNLTSSAATGRTGSTSGFGTAAGFLQNSAPGALYTVAKDNKPANGIKDNGNVFSSNSMISGGKSYWNYPAVYDTYNSFRGGTSLPGVFTSNHDIARVINRIAGTGTSDGIEEQGNITTSNYADYEKSANCVKIAEVLFPGVTWVYYGDEIGMTGNFPAGKNSKSDYADLYYRQPMKWVQDGHAGDAYGTTDFYVTGSSMKVDQDEVNKSTAVVGALAQADSSTSDFAVLARFIGLKNGTDATGAALRLGNFKAENYANGNLAANVLCFSRTLNGTTIKVAVNFNNQSINANSLEGTVLATYNNASQSTLPAYSAIVVKA